jgi:Lon protease-like protein
MMLPLHIFEPRYRKMINLCLEDSAPFGVVLIQSGRKWAAAPRRTASARMPASRAWSGFPAGA